MNGLDYLEINDVVNSYCSEVSDLSVNVESKLVDKAKFITQRMKVETDLTSRTKLKKEKEYVELVAEFIDKTRSTMEYLSTTMEATTKDYWMRVVKQER